MTDTVSVRSHTVPAIVLVIVCLVLFCNTFNNEFVWDDPALIAGNAYIRDYKNIPLFFTPHYVNESYPVRGLYRPIREISLAVDYFFWKTYPFGYHVTNLSLHAINVVLLFYLVSIIAGQGADRQRQGITDRRLFMTLPFLTALFFAAHPIHTESLNLIKNRSDLLAFLFFLSSFLLFIKYNPSRSNRTISRLSMPGAWLCFILAVLSKEMALTLPGVLALYAVSFFTGPERKKTLIRIVPYGLIILIYFCFLLSFIRPHHPAPVGVPLPAGIEQHTLTVIETLGCYFWMLIAPIKLSAEHAFALPESLLETSVLLSLTSLLFIAIGAVRAYQKSRVVFFALGWMLLTLLPAANIIYLASRPIAEQRLYIPSFGFCLLLAYGIERLYGTGTKQFIQARAVAGSRLLAVVIVCLYALVTVNRNVDWRDEFTFYARTLAANPTSARMHYNFGNALRAARKYEAAISHYQSALRLKPDYLKAHYNLGMIFYEAEHYDEAISHFQAVLRMNPDNVTALNNLGVAFYDSGRLEDACRFFQDALRITPDDVAANWNMGDVLFDMGRWEEAVGNYSTVLRLQPDSFSVYISLGKIFIRQGKLDRAIRVYLDALAFYPDNDMLNYALGYALAEKGRYEEAITRFAIVLQLRPDCPEINFKIGDIYLTQGEAGKAVSYYLKAVQENPAHVRNCINLDVAGMTPDDIDNKITTFCRALTITPADIEACYNLGVALMNRQNYRQALTLFAKVLDINPDHAPAKHRHTYCKTLLEKDSPSSERL